ncbi:MAG: hypothetical protein IT371_16185 [Deltaproteobacteria bacterium]|nr:hypothetical protein [Deltaproteobacteria bacterium]
MQRLRTIGFLSGLLLAVGLLRCVSIPGMEEGGPCNDKGICKTGLVCEEGLCRSKSAAASSWEVMRSPVDTALAAVWGASASEVWAVGPGPTILTYQGQGLDWSRVTHSFGASGGLVAIWGRSKSELYAGGGSLLVAYDGRAWTRQQLFDKTSGTELKEGYGIAAIAGTAAQLYAVGSTNGKPYHALFRHAGGTRWETVPEVNLAFSGVDLWVEGNEIAIVGDSPHAKHYTGSVWVEKNLGKRVALDAVAGDGSRLVAVGASSEVFEYAGGSWKVAAPARARWTARDLWLLPGSDLFVVGEGGGYGADFSPVERCGTTCVAQVMPEGAKPSQNKKMYSIWGAADGTLFVVGDSGLILRRRKP